MKGLLLILVCLAAAAGVEYREFRILAERDCHTVRMLAHRAPAVAAWISEAIAEPFLGLEALAGAPAGTIATYRSRSRAITSEFSARLIPPGVIEGLRRLELAQEGEPFAAALKELPAATAAYACREPDPADPSIIHALDRQVAEAERVWQERKAQLPEDKAAFARDRAIFCKGDKLITSLHSVVEAAAKRCEGAPAGSKLAKSCGNGRGHEAVEAEIRDVEKEKELNLRKLRQKWPARVVAGLRC